MFFSSFYWKFEWKPIEMEALTYVLEWKTFVLTRIYTNFTQPLIRNFCQLPFTSQILSKIHFFLKFIINKKWLNGLLQQQQYQHIITNITSQRVPTWFMTFKSMSFIYMTQYTGGPYLIRHTQTKIYTYLFIARMNFVTLHENNTILLLLFHILHISPMIMLNYTQCSFMTRSTALVDELINKRRGVFGATPKKFSSLVNQWSMLER